ncbi:MAG: hypothetical protein F4239_07500 [Gammaproteobacteria bacterium]|nr:hypothetical protein [Gammaproteobacteria bacterium]
MAVEKALTDIADYPVRVHCAGRTDTGVHACGQVFHFETDSQRSEFSQSGYTRLPVRRLDN